MSSEDDKTAEYWQARIDKILEKHQSNSLLKKFNEQGMDFSDLYKDLEESLEWRAKNGGENV